MIIKVPIYAELIGKVDPDSISFIQEDLKKQFYLMVRKRKIRLTFHLEDQEYDYSDAGVDDVRVLDDKEALEHLRVKK